MADSYGMTLAKSTRFLAEHGSLRAGFVRGVQAANGIVQERKATTKADVAPRKPRVAATKAR